VAGPGLYFPSALWVLYGYHFFMPLTQSHEITAASRLTNVRYAIRDLACVADEVVKQ